VEFNVAQLLKGHTGDQRDYDIADETVLLDEGQRTTVNGTVRLIRTPGGVLADASLSITAIEQCARCLKQLDEVMSIHVEEVYYPTVDVDTGHQLPPPEDPEAFLISARHVLDLREPVRQYRWMSGALAPLCRAECRGLCPVCGANLNEEPPHQHEPVPDDRWAQLAELRQRLYKD
jgi:DUF177 domain-containing protein